MKRRFREPLVSRPRFMVFVAEPPTQPTADMEIDRTVGFANRPQTEVVSPTDQHPIEPFYDCLWSPPDCISSGLVANSSTDALYPFL